MEVNNNYGYANKQSYPYILYIWTSLGLTFLTLLSLLILLSSTSSASDTAVDDINITIPVSCNITTNLDTAHNASIYNGTYKEDIGTTTFTTLCNDKEGYSIYAIGYTNEEYGNTNLLATVGGVLSPIDNIVTGTATTGNTSNWAMKLTPVANTYAPTILSDTDGSFSDYHKVPTTYTKVATLNSSVDATIGSTLQTTYSTYISPTQPGGTYIGKVKYTLVHPANGDKPLEPVVTGPGKISYNPNSSSVVDSMGDQTIAATDT